MATTIQLKRADTVGNWLESDHVLEHGEAGVAIDTGEVRFGNGVDQWANLPNADDRYASAKMFQAWSLPLSPSGSGGGIIRIDSTAAANIPDTPGSRAARGTIAAGRNALGAATNGHGTIAIGDNTMGEGNPGDHNLGLGAAVLTHLDGGHRNIGIGSLAGHFMTTGYQNILIGRDSGHSIIDGAQNVGIGYCSLGTLHGPIGMTGQIEQQHSSSTSRSTALGTSSAMQLTGNEVIAIGNRCLLNAHNTYESVYIGNNVAQYHGEDASENDLLYDYTTVAGTYTHDGTQLTINAVGHKALAGKYVSLNFTSGAWSGTSSGQWMKVATVSSADTFTINAPVEATASGDVTILKRETAQSVTIGYRNTIIGAYAMSETKNNNSYNTVIGESAGRTGMGSHYALLGARSGYNLTTATSVSALGSNSARTLVGGGDVTTESNITCLGYNSRVSGSNQVQLGGSGTTVYAFGAVQDRSDVRDKTDIRDTTLGLDFIDRLRPIDFKWDYRDSYIETDDETGEVTKHDQDGSRKGKRYHHGFPAQQVKEVIDDLGVDFGGYQDHSVNGGDDVLSIGYTELIAPLVKAVQELKAEVEALKAERA